MKVALYGRVSTTAQDPEVQLQPLRRWTLERGHEVFREYVDAGFSGGKSSRPALDELIHEAGSRRFGLVLVWKFDRFARSVPDLLQALEYFRAMQIDFVSLTESIDTTTPIGRMVFTFLGAVAAFERDLVRERTLAGLEKARSSGKHIGRPRKLITDEAVVEVLSRDPRPTYRQAAKELGVSAGWLSNHVRQAAQKGPG